MLKFSDLVTCSFPKKPSEEEQLCICSQPSWNALPEMRVVLNWIHFKEKGQFCCALLGCCTLPALQVILRQNLFLKSFLFLSHFWISSRKKLSILVAIKIQMRLQGSFYNNVCKLSALHVDCVLSTFLYTTEVLRENSISELFFFNKDKP